MANYVKQILLGVGVGLAASVGITKYQNYKAKQNLVTDFKEQELQPSLRPLYKDTFEIQYVLDNKGDIKDTLYIQYPETIYIEKTPDNKTITYAVNYKGDTIRLDTLRTEAQAIIDKQFKNLKKLK